MEQYKKDIISQNKEFQDIIYPLITNDTVQQMKNFKQHYETTCFEHCYTAAYHCYCICKKLNLDYKSATRAAMLHDLFLYDWRKRQPDRKGLHAFTHGKTACENASKLFDLNDKEKDIIEKHMWPVTVAFPKSIEGFNLYSFTIFLYSCVLFPLPTSKILKSRLFMKKAFRYAYLAFSLVIIKI